MPALPPLEIRQFSRAMLRAREVPAATTPLKSLPRMLLLIMLTVEPLDPALRIPASVPTPLSVIDFVIVTAPYPPGSSTLISPLAAVFDMAPANVLHGAVRLHGLASSPTPDTQVRVAWAKAGD